MGLPKFIDDAYSPLNLSGYAKNNPVSFVDPTGLFFDIAGAEFQGPADPSPGSGEFETASDWMSHHAFDPNGRDAAGIIPDHKLETAVSIATGADALKELAAGALRAESRIVFGEASKAVTSLSKVTVETEKAIAGEITGFTKHGLNQAIGRDGGIGVRPDAILDAVRNPVSVLEQVARKEGLSNTFRYVGERATVILNEAGKIVTTWGRLNGK